MPKGYKARNYGESQENDREPLTSMMSWSAQQSTENLTRETMNQHVYNPSYIEKITFGCTYTQLYMYMGISINTINEQTNNSCLWFTLCDKKLGSHHSKNHVDNESQSLGNQCNSDLMMDGFVEWQHNNMEMVGREYYEEGGNLEQHCEFVA